MRRLPFREIDPLIGVNLSMIRLRSVDLPAPATIKRHAKNTEHIHM